ncbi:MAG TPA: hypothetical protein VNO22_02735 [Planctomycetota bacterium]|jgi:hypothetical protein|nr:hypothetical protein [Planctomycetota bacterium]
MGLGRWAGALALGLALAVAAAAQEEKKQDKKPGRALGLPTPADLKEKVAFDDEQCKKADEVLAGYKDKIAELQKKMKETPEADRKAVMQEVKALRAEVLGKLREICKDDEQKKKFDEATAPVKKKKEGAGS